MSSVKARKMYRQDNLQKAGLVNTANANSPRRIKIIANTKIDANAPPRQSKSKQPTNVKNSRRRRFELKISREFES